MIITGAESENGHKRALKSIVKIHIWLRRDMG